MKVLLEAALEENPSCQGLFCSSWAVGSMVTLLGSRAGHCSPLGFAVPADRSF